jgi:anthranilate synthase component II
LILIIDNYDSFTYNLYQQIAKQGQSVRVFRHDAIDIEQIATIQPTHIVISPGPKRPQDSGVSLEVIRQFYKNIQILGVCLGHQCIGEVFGSKTVQAPLILHGKTDTVHHSGLGLLLDLPNPFIAARYNSLTLDKVPKEFTLTAWSEDGSIMAMQHQQYPLHGLQFHPESFMTPQGDVIIKSFLQCTAS